ncbi:hypothetical protein LPB68_13705 [Paenibacillus crassostreae]|nr:hypothetical protein LPB68_13705 [Paenibacillus crassostreae]
MHLGSVALRKFESCRLVSLVVVVRVGDQLDWLPPSSQRPCVRWIETCVNAHLGMSYSLRCGLNSVRSTQPDAVIIVLADQPFITAKLVNHLIDTFENSPELDYVANAYGGVIMPPVLISRRLFNAIQSLEGDQGASVLLRSPECRGVVIEADSSLYFMDADTRKDFETIVTQWTLNTDR